MRYLLHLFTLLLVLFFLTNTIFSQEKMVTKDGFRQGYRAIQFGIGSNFRLTNFGDTGLSLLRFKSDSKANFIRGYFNINYSDVEDKRKDNSTRPEQNPSTQTRIGSNQRELFDTELRVYLGSLNYLNTNSDILPFISKSLFLGTIFNSRNTEAPEEIENTLIEESMYKNSALTIQPTLGFNLGFGVDYFVANNISLNAQTGFEFTYIYNYNDQNNNLNQSVNGEIVRIQISDLNVNSHNFTLRTTGVLFGLTAYFQ